MGSVELVLRFEIIFLSLVFFILQKPPFERGCVDFFYPLDGYISIKLECLRNVLFTKFFVNIRSCPHETTMNK